MKQNARIVFACTIALYGLSAQAAETPIGVPQDWSSRAIIHRQPMSPDEFDAAGRSHEIAGYYRDPRYVASLLRRIETETPRVARAQAGELAPKK